MASIPASIKALWKGVLFIKGSSDPCTPSKSISASVSSVGKSSGESESKYLPYSSVGDSKFPTSLLYLSTADSTSNWDSDPTYFLVPLMLVKDGTKVLYLAFPISTRLP